jgi:hypothetical protein
MPDCRAYEMVTPSYKGGAAVEQLNAISPDGSRLLVTSFGGFGGIENNEQGEIGSGAGLYELSRSTDGWSTESLRPPATVVSHSSYVGASTDLGRTLWELIEEPQPPNEESPPEKELLNPSTRYRLAVRVHEPGSKPAFAAIGPENPTSQNIDRRDFTFEGASSDMSRVVFSIEARGNDVWPGDTTEQGEGFESLYEYAGSHEAEPALVGVKNQGKPHGSPHINEGAELIGNCGTALGAPRVSAFNAVSSSGEIVFFTSLACGSGPPANSLYARIGEERTVAISQPQRPISAQQGNGPGPQECDAACEAAPQMAASFQGAAQDGSRVFFTTSQSLLNGDEGGEGTGNDLYEADIENARLTRLTQVSHDSSGPANVLGVARISQDGARVYYVAEGALTAANAEGQAPASGKDNLYVYDSETGVNAFVAALSPADSEDWKAEDEGRPTQTTSTGRFLAFTSVERLTGSEDRGTVTQLFEYDAQTGRIARVSIGQHATGGGFCPETNQIEAGYDCNGNTTNPSFVPAMPTASYLAGASPTEAASKLAVAEDGRVFFMSRNPLTPLAVEGSKNIYEYSGEDVHLVAAGEDPQLELAAFGASFFEHDRLVGVDQSGADLFFNAVGQLVPQDTDTQADLYDAHVEGGFPEPAMPAECEGQACRGSSSAPPSLPTAVSVALPGEVATTTILPSSPQTSKLKRFTRAQKLARALQACAKKPKARRKRCRAAARKRYAAKTADARAKGRSG